MLCTAKALTFTLVACLAVAAHAATPGDAATDPRTRTEALLAAFQRVKAPPEGERPSDADSKANAAVFAELDGFIDRPTLTGEPIAPHRARLTDAQLQRFGDLFWQVLRMVAYPDSGAFLRKAKWSLRPARGMDVALHARLEEEDFETDVVFHWKAFPDGLRLVDVSFDGASLVKDYQNQFGRILAKDGALGLLVKLEARRDDEIAKRGALP